MEDALLGKIAVSVAGFAIDKPYTYWIPDSLSESLLPGMRVMVPFGRGNRHVEGLVLVLERGRKPDKCKQILSILDDKPVLDQEGIQLALWMRERYFCTVYEAMKAMLPAGLYFSLRDSYFVPSQVSEEDAYRAAGSSKQEKKLLDLLFYNGRSLERGELYEAFAPRSPVATLHALREKGIISIQTSVSRGVGDKLETVAELIQPVEQALEAVGARAKMQQEIIRFLNAVHMASAKEIGYFTGAKRSTLRALETKGIIQLSQQECYRQIDEEPVLPTPMPELNEEQEQAFQGISHMLGQAGCALLYGVTGSGKTPVYIHLIHQVLEQGKQAMVLVPEIVLTPQMLRIFRAQFGDQVAILHSSLSAGARYDEWKRARNGDARVVIGTRSAVFAPLSQLGMIILDEEQESSYKSETVPRYHAREIAKYRCGRHQAVLVLGSATPSVESMYQAQTGIYQLFQLTKRYNEQALPQVLIADLKEELRAGNSGTISSLLREKITETTQRGEQVILFLNRRGANRMALCAQCGEAPECPRCSVKLTYHSKNGRLMCHYCGFTQPLPDRCPKCGGVLTFFGAGIQKVEEELKELFPEIRVLRMDADTVSASHTHEQILAQFDRQRIPILIGTQMVAKGLDFANVTLVGVIDADLSLYVDDFRASERTFSLLTQVVGRAGRGAHKGSAVIQTYTPKNDIIVCAARQDYDSFYQQESEHRRLRQFPPFRDLYVLYVTGAEEGRVLQSCIRLREGFAAWQNSQVMTGIPFDLLGPAPAIIVKMMNRYRYSLTISGKNSKKMRNMIDYVIAQAKGDKRNKGISITVDLNPMDSF